MNKLIYKLKRFWRLKTQKSWPAGCGYQGYEFGGGYLDSECFGGRLFDMDNFYDGTLYEPMEDIPCPSCRRTDAIIYWAERSTDLPNKGDFCRAVNLVDDIRKNRGMEVAE